MRFRQLDRITGLNVGRDITAERLLSDREGYFQDHFPEFPVMPGVLTLEAMFQACHWLVRETDAFANSVVLLKEVLNVKFAGLVRPGQTLTLSASIKQHAPQVTTLSAAADVDGATIARGRLVLERFQLADRYPQRAMTDAFLRKNMRAQFELLRPQSPGHVPRTPSHHRWMWIDRLAEFVGGRRAVAVKTVSMADEPIDLYLPGFPVMPCSLILEGFAQTGGILIGACQDFEKRIVLAKVSKAVFHRPAVPGDTLVYETELTSQQPEGAMVHGRSRIGDELQGEVDLFFAYLDERMVGAELMTPADLVALLRLYGYGEVARTEAGRPLEIPARLLDAERIALEAE